MVKHIKYDALKISSNIDSDETHQIMIIYDLKISLLFGN